MSKIDENWVMDVLNWPEPWGATKPPEDGLGWLRTYGLLAGATYCLQKAHVTYQQISWDNLPDYDTQVLPELGAIFAKSKFESQAFLSWEIGFCLNRAQHSVAAAVDRIVNALILKTLESPPDYQDPFYGWLAGRVWALAAAKWQPSDLQDCLKEFDKVLRGSSKASLPEFAGNPVSDKAQEMLLNATRFSKPPQPAWCVAWCIAATNAWKHLPRDRRARREDRNAAKDIHEKEIEWTTAAIEWTAKFWRAGTIATLGEG